MPYEVSLQCIVFFLKYLCLPCVLRYEVKEVLQYQKRHPEFSTLVEAASARLGKPIGHSETATLLYLHDTVGLPMEVILMEIAYAVSIGKGNMRYVEKLALDWCDRDIATISAVDGHIRYLEACRRAGERVAKLLDAPKALSTAQAELAEKWLMQWRFSEAMLLKAADITHVTNTFNVHNARTEVCRLKRTFRFP